MHMKHKKASLIILIAVCAGCLLFVYGRFAPGSGFPFPRCIFFQLTGYRCPGCGLQRALHSMLNLDLSRPSSIMHSSLPYCLSLHCCFSHILPKVGFLPWTRLCAADGSYGRLGFLRFCGVSSGIFTGGNGVFVKCNCVIIRCHSVNY